MAELAFVNRPPAFPCKVGAFQTNVGICAPIQSSKYAQTIPSVMRASVAVSRTTKIVSSRKQPYAQGPFCPMVDQDILRHCLMCAKDLNRKRLQKEASVQKLLTEARQALGVAQRGRAERLFLRALVVDPANTKTYFLFALQVQRRDPTLARDLFRYGVRVDPNDARLLQAWGLFESKQGKLARAQRLLRRSVDLEPRNAPVLKWKVLFPEEITEG